MQLSPHFKKSEFACKCGCGFDDINPDLIIVLEDVRAHFNSPVIINSACRCAKHNKAVGGTQNSQHVKGTAADIKVKNVTPKQVADYLESKYPSTHGIGRYKTFTHIDVRPNKARWGQMVESAYTREEYIKQYSILRNPRFWRVFQEARIKCMELAINGLDYKTIPLFSHDATYQSVFTNGWKSVSEQDIRLQKALLNPARHHYEKVA